MKTTSTASIGGDYHDPIVLPEVNLREESIRATLERLLALNLRDDITIAEHIALAHCITEIAKAAKKMRGSVWLISKNCSDTIPK